MNCFVFWDVTPFRTLKVHSRRPQASLSLQPAAAGFSLGFLFNPEEVGDTFLRNVS
jgi:hypothetical protein